MRKLVAIVVCAVAAGCGGKGDTPPPMSAEDAAFQQKLQEQFLDAKPGAVIEIPAGSLGSAGNTLIPPRSLIVSQGALTTTTFGTGVSQPLTQLLKVKAANDIAGAEVHATIGRARQIENSIALSVHQIYYSILIAEMRRSALQAKIRASEDLQSERSR